MKNHILLLLIIACSFSHSEVQSQSFSDEKPKNASDDNRDYDIDTVSIGDINHDKIPDFAFIKGTKFLYDSNEWDDCSKTACAVTVSFSCGFPDIYFNNAVAAAVENIGDIDTDGFDEIIISPSWIIGCWGRLHFFSCQKSKWKYVGFVEQNICDDAPYINLIERKGKNKIAVKEQVWEDGDRVEKIKIIKIK